MTPLTTKGRYMMIYDYENGYAVAHTLDTVERINSRKAGRPKIRYDVVKRDGNMTVVHHNLTKKELEAVALEIKNSGNVLL